MVFIKFATRPNTPYGGETSRYSLLNGNVHGMKNYEKKANSQNLLWGFVYQVSKTVVHVINISIAKTWKNKCLYRVFHMDIYKSKQVLPMTMFFESDTFPFRLMLETCVHFDFWNKIF